MHVRGNSLFKHRCSQTCIREFTVITISKGYIFCSVADPGCLSRIPDPGSDFFPSRIPDPNCLHPGSRILIKEFKYFNPKKSKNRFLSSKNMIQVVHPGSRIRMLTFSHPGSRIPDPGVKKAPNPGSRIPDPNPQHCILEQLSGSR
jgi:hypothetical protein